MFFHGDRNKREIAVTFDDGPCEETLAVLELLKKYEVKATFFLVGKMFEGRAGIIEKIKENGHEVGNHTFSHKRLWFKSKRFIEEDVKKCDEELGKVGISTDLIRFPGFKYGPNALSVCRRLGKRAIFQEKLSWSQEAYDWYRPWLKMRGLTRGPVRIDKVIEKTLSGTRNGSILGFHDYLQEIGPHPEIIPILERIIPELKNRGFKFVTISELLNNSPTK